MLQLNEARRDSCDVTLLVGKSDTAGSLGILQFWIGVDASVANAAVQSIHDHGQFNWRERIEHVGHARRAVNVTCSEWTRNAADEDGLSRIQRL